MWFFLALISYYSPDFSSMQCAPIVNFSVSTSALNWTDLIFPSVWRYLFLLRLLHFSNTSLHSLLLQHIDDTFPFQLFITFFIFNKLSEDLVSEQVQKIIGGMSSESEHSLENSRGKDVLSYFLLYFLKNVPILMTNLQWFFELVPKLDLQITYWKWKK